MALPSWLASLTGANKFAAPGGQATFGDLLQAGGHSMLQHYRGRGGTFGAEPPLNLQSLMHPQGPAAQPPITGRPLPQATNAHTPFTQPSANPWGIGMSGGVW